MTVATRKQRRQQVVVDNSWEDPHSGRKMSVWIGTVIASTLQQNAYILAQRHGPLNVGTVPRSNKIFFWCRCIAAAAASVGDCGANFLEVGLCVGTDGTYGSQTNDYDERQHYDVLNCSWAIFFFQEIYNAVSEILHALSPHE